MKRVLFSLMAMLLLSASGIAQTTYTMVNSASELEAGAQYIMVGYDNDGNAFAMSFQKSNNRYAVAVEEVGDAITATLATAASDSLTFEFTLGGSAGAWTIFDPLNNGYLCAPGGGNYLRTQTSLDDKGRWTITDGEEGGMFPVSNGGEEQSYMRYNISSTLFGCYKESSNVAAPVYFFKAGGAATPLPEPSNYPTQFQAMTDGVDITLRWNDATGDQLPSKYLVLASLGDITVPTDGTPVAEAELAKNVAYGVQNVTFSGLQSNTTYHFAIFPYTNSGAHIDYKTDGNYPTVTQSTEDMEIILFEDFEVEGSLGTFTAHDLYGDQAWQQSVYQGTTFAKMSGYAGQAFANEDWLISPRLQTGYMDLWIEFRTAMKYDGNPLRVLASTDYDGQSEPTDFEWTDLTAAFEYSPGEYVWVESGALNVKEEMYDQNPNGGIFVAFVYTSTTEAASTWEIDYFKAYTKHYDAVNENAVPAVNLYPNPANEQVSFMLDSDAQVSVFDMTGRKVSEMNVAAGNTQLNVSELESGVYFVNFRYANGTTAVSKFVKF